jgi:ABC-2 type transport system permease protein
MKLIPHLKKGLNIITKDIVMMVVSFLILPMSLALVYGNMQKDLFDNKGYEVAPIKVHFEYNEGTDKGAALKGVLSQREVKDFIHEESFGPDYTVIISDDFKTVEIMGKDEGAVEFLMLRNFLETLLNNFNKYETMGNTIKGLNLSGMEKQNLIRSAFSALEKSQGKPSAREKIVEGYKTLGSVEYFTISMFSFTSLIMIVTLAGYYFKEVKEGIVKRSLSTPNNRRDYFLGFMLTAFIVSIVISFIYVFINKARGAAFSGRPLDLAVIILLQGLLCSSAVGAVIAFIKKEATANTVMSLLLVVPSIFGGTFFYTEVIGSGVIKTMMNSVPNALILNSYKSLAITGNLKGAQSEIIAMTALSLILLALSIIKIERKWEV